MRKEEQRKCGTNKEKEICRSIFPTFSYFPSPLPPFFPAFFLRYLYFFFVHHLWNHVQNKTARDIMDTIQTIVHVSKREYLMCQVHIYGRLESSLAA